MGDVNFNRHGKLISIQADSAAGSAWMAANLEGEWRGNTLWIDASHEERVVLAMRAAGLKVDIEP